MATADVAHLVRALATTPSRRSLAALTLGGGVAALAGPGNADARKKCKKKKKKCPTLPFCAGKNACFSDETIECDSTGFCFCFLAAETGAPFCGHVPGGLSDVASCLECEADTTCIFAAPNCSPTNEPFACVPPCPNPF